MCVCVEYVYVCVYIHINIHIHMPIVYIIYYIYIYIYIYTADKIYVDETEPLRCRGSLAMESRSMHGIQKPATDTTQELRCH